MIWKFKLQLINFVSIRVLAANYIMLSKIRQSWNSYLSRRRLDGLWLTFQGSLEDDEMTNAQKDEALASFHQCFLAMSQQAMEELAQIQAGANVDKSPELIESAGVNKSARQRAEEVSPENHLAEEQMPGINLSFFAHKEQYLTTLCSYLQSNGHSIEDWQNWQTTESNLPDTLQSIQVVLEEGHNLSLEMEHNYEQVIKMSLFQLGKAKNITAARKLLGLLNTIFSYEKQQMIVFAQKDGFLSLLKIFDSKMPNATELVIKYFVKWLQVEVEDILDEFEQPLNSDSNELLGRNRKNNLATVITKMTSKLINDFRMGLDEDADDTPFEKSADCRDHNQNEATNLHISTRGSDQILNKGTNEATYPPESQVRKLLRDGQFLREVTERIQICEEKNLSNYIHILKILNVFTQVNYQQSEGLGVFKAVIDRFQNGTLRMEAIFTQLLQIISKYSTTNSRNQHLWEFVISLIEVMVKTQPQDDHEKLAVTCLKSLKLSFQDQTTWNTSIFLNQSGYERMKDLIVYTAARDDDNEILGHLLDFIMVLLFILRNEKRSHTFAIEVAELLLSRQKTGQILVGRAKELFYFLRLLVKDKMAQVEALGQIESDSLIDIEQEVEKLIDGQLKGFLKLTFKLYFDYSAKESLRADCQMLLLCALELQEKVNQVVVQHDVPSIIILFKESEDDHELEEINFAQTIQELLLQRNALPAQDIFDGYLATKLSIVFQDTVFLSLDQIKTMIDALLKEPAAEPLFTLVSPDRTNPFFAAIFSQLMNSRASQLQTYILENALEIVKTLCSALKHAIQSNSQGLVVQNLHRLVLMSQNSRSFKQAVENTFDFQQLVKDLDISSFQVEAQLFVLQCLLEMQADKIIYIDSIMSYEEILRHQNSISNDAESLQQFLDLLNQASAHETLIENRFHLQIGIEKLSILNLDSSFVQEDEDGLVASQMKIASRKTSQGYLRENSLGFALFLMTLTQTNLRVQLQVLEDLNMLAGQSLRNIRVMVQQNLQVYLLFMLKMVQEQDDAENMGAFSREVISLLSILISYGVCIPQSAHQNLLVNCLSSQRRLHDRLIDSVIDCLTTSFSQISGYVHFMDTEAATGALKINGGAIGVSCWLLTPQVNQKTMKALLCTLNLAPSTAIKVELVLDDNLEAQEDEFSQLSDENLSQRSEEAHEFDDNQNDIEKMHKVLQTQHIFYLKISVEKQRSDRTCEVIASHRISLEDMIEYSVFHIQGFNHYVMQMNLNGTFDIYINSHELGSKLFSEQLSGSPYLYSLDFVAHASVANLSLLHTALSDRIEIESLRNSDFMVKQQELMGLSQRQVAHLDAHYVTLNGQAANRQSTVETDAVISMTVFLPFLEDNEGQILEAQMQLAKCSVEIPVQSESLNIEIFQETEFIMTLKRYLSTEHSINAIFDLFELASNHEQTLKCLRLLASIIIQNKSNNWRSALITGENNERHGLLNIFDQVDGYTKLQAILAQKIPEMHDNQVRQVFAQLIEISCDEQNCSLRIDEKAISVSARSFRQPLLYSNRIRFLQIGLALVKNSPVQKSIQFLEMVQILLKEDENLQIFRKHIGFNSILALFRLIEQNHRLLSLYDISLAIFELFISAICRSDLSQLLEQERQELTLIFEFLLSRDLERRLKFIKSSRQNQSANDQSVASFQNLLASSQKQSELVTRVLIDCLSIISIHILNETQGLEPRSHSVLLEKIAQCIDLPNFIFSLLQAYPVNNNQTSSEVQEYAFKFLQMLLYLSEDFRTKFAKQGGYDTLCDFTILRGSSNSAARDGDNERRSSILHLSELDIMEAQALSQMPELLNRNTNFRNTSKTSTSGSSGSNFSLNMIMLDAATCRFDNAYVMFSEKQTFVHTVMNRSRIAEQIVAQVKSTLKKPKIVKIVYFDMIQTFLKSLAQLKDDVSRQICLKHLHWLVVENEENLAALLDDRLKLRNFVERIFEYELDVVQRDSTGQADDQLRYNRQKRSTKDNSEVETSNRLLKLIKRHSLPQDLMMQDEQVNNQGAARNDRRNQQPLIKSLDIAQEIIKDVLVRDLERPTHLSQTFQLLEQFPDTESVFHYQVITWLIRHFQRNPKVHERNVIENLQKILANLDRFLGDDHLYVSMKAINLINTLALKSSNEFRQHLKSLKLIELRDRLLLDHIRKTHVYFSKCQEVDGREELPREEFVNAICCLFSYGQLAPKPAFAANLCIEYLTLALLYIGELQQTSRPQVKYGDYFTHFKTRILEEVMPFFEQKDMSPELLAYYEGKGDAEFFLRLRKFLSERVSGHLETSRQNLDKVFGQATAHRHEFKQRKGQVARVHTELSGQIQQKLQVEFEQIFKKVKKVIL